MSRNGPRTVYTQEADKATVSSVGESSKQGWLSWDTHAHADVGLLLVAGRGVLRLYPQDKVPR